MDVAILKQLINLAAHTTTTGSLKKTAAAREVVGGKNCLFRRELIQQCSLKS